MTECTAGLFFRLLWRILARFFYCTLTLALRAYQFSVFNPCTHVVDAILLMTFSLLLGPFPSALLHTYLVPMPDTVQSAIRGCSAYALVEKHCPSGRMDGVRRLCVFTEGGDMGSETFASMDTPPSFASCLVPRIRWMIWPRVTRLRPPVAILCRTPWPPHSGSLRSQWGIGKYVCILGMFFFFAVAFWRCQNTWKTSSGLFERPSVLKVGLVWAWANRL